MVECSLVKTLKKSDYKKFCVDLNTKISNNRSNEDSSLFMAIGEYHTNLQRNSRWSSHDLVRWTLPITTKSFIIMFCIIFRVESRSELCFSVFIMKGVAFSLGNGIRHLQLCLKYRASLQFPGKSDICASLCQKYFEQKRSEKSKIKNTTLRLPLTGVRDSYRCSFRSVCGVLYSPISTLFYGGTDMQ